MRPAIVVALFIATSFATSCKRELPPRILVPSPTEVFQPDDWAKAASEEEGRQKR